MAVYFVLNMAKQKQKILVKITANPVEPIQVWADNPGEAIRDIQTVEGVAACRIDAGGPIRIMTDPRYDTQEIATEIEDLLVAEVPDIFKEEE